MELCEEYILPLKHIVTRSTEGTDRIWNASVDLGQTTLLVGRNATGKSKILASIANLSRLVAKKQSFPDAKYKAVFADADSPFTYEFHVRDSVVTHELVTIGTEQVLKRSVDGKGKIKAVAAKQNDLEFQVPTNELAVVAKRDFIQHPFLEPFQLWASSLRFYRFNDFKREAFGLLRDGMTGSSPDPSDYQQAIGLFNSGEKKLGNPFKQAIIVDMNRIGYQVEDVKLATLDEIKFDPPIGAKATGLSVKEKDLKGWTSQFWMSDGMFRALALIIHAAYAEMASVPSAMVVDDIGEGLDYERSTLLIQLLMERASRKAIQLVMSTNDRFAMNAVPLDVWCGLRRTVEGVETVSQQTHPDVFEQFKLTGLNNFDFFKTDFFEAAKTHA